MNANTLLRVAFAHSVRYAGGAKPAGGDSGHYISTTRKGTTPAIGRRELILRGTNGPLDPFPGKCV